MKNLILFCIIVLLSASGCSREPRKTVAPPPPAETRQLHEEAPPSSEPAQAQGPQAHSARNKAVSSTTHLATIGRDEKPGPVSHDVAKAHPDVIPVLQVIFSEGGGGVAYVANRNNKACVVHNGRPCTPYDAIGSVELSPDGSRIAYGALIGDKWRMVVDGKEGETFSAVRNPKFSPDGRHLAYQGMRGDLWHLVVDERVNSGTKTRYRPHEFGGDSQHIVYIDNVDETTLAGRLVVSDINFKNERVIDRSVTDMFLSADGTSVAAISRNAAGRELLLQFNIAKPSDVSKGAAYDKVLNPAFGPAGNDLAYFGERNGRSYAVYNGKEEILPEGLTPGVPVINKAGKSVGVLMSANNGLYFYQMFRNSGRVGNAYDEAEGLVYSSDGAASAFAASKNGGWFVVANGKEGPAFDRVVSPVFSPDSKRLVYRARKKGKRFIVVADPEGKTLRHHPEYEQVFQPVFTADGKSVAYGVKDGNELVWKVEKLD